VFCVAKRRYLTPYDVRLPFKIEVEWCSPETDVIVSPPADDVYFHPKILALEVKLLMAPFIRDVVVHFKVPPLQLITGAWQIVLRFEALCAT